MLLGGMLGTLPDMDVLVRYSDAVESFTYHRSWSHSLIVLSLISVPIAWLLMRHFPTRWYLQATQNRLAPPRPGYALWFAAVFLILITHAILDGFTLYGTQLLWPLPVDAVAWGSVFIIDPLYTGPLLIGLLLAYRKRVHARRYVLAGLLFSTLYLGYTLLAQHSMRDRAIQALQQQNLGTHNVLVAPTPLSLLWRIVSIDGEQYYEGFASLLDNSDRIEFNAYPSNRALIDELYEHWSVSRLDWFTGEMISADRVDDNLIVNDLRMGIEASYIFRFNLGSWSNGEFEPRQSTQLPVEIDLERMRTMFGRALNEELVIEPTLRNGLEE
jgi:inner membrane protein